MRRDLDLDLHLGLEQSRDDQDGRGRVVEDGKREVESADAEIGDAHALARTPALGGGLK